MQTTERELLNKINAMPDNKAMKELYRQLYLSLAKELSNWIKDFPEMTTNQQREFIRQGEVAKYLERICGQLDIDVNVNVSEVLKDVGALSYNGTYYQLEKNNGINLGKVLFDDNALMQVVNTPINGKLFSERLHAAIIDKLQPRVTQAVVNGILRGEGYRLIAARLRNTTNMAYNDALRIARTEGGRISSTMNYTASKEIEAKGIDVKKQWVTTLDRRTRQDHIELDGKTIGVDEYFEVSGHRALHPHGFHVASEDINCRCAVINVIDDVEPEYRLDNESKQQIKNMSYDQWLKNKGIEKRQ